MYIVDEFDTVISLPETPRPEPGAPCPMVFATEQRLVISYWIPDEPPFPPTTAPLAIIEFRKPYMHFFGPPNDEAISGHPLSARGLHPSGVFRIDGSSLVRSLERMNAVHRHHNPDKFAAMIHYIFTFHDSTFECVVESFEARIEQAGLNEEYELTLNRLRRH